MKKNMENRDYWFPWLTSLMSGLVFGMTLITLLRPWMDLPHKLVWGLLFWFLGGVISAVTFLVVTLRREERKTGQRVEMPGAMNRLRWRT
ncbi:MAG: hypothetical protein KatS3mg044_0818 [Rhodothermaceae bacterium]|nr:MAG: hypothetical protein D6746_10785 [Bacteroidota bacterium]GIV61952.1 MAG: hypothetical protein KatS3mg044_0818 [Rhodothermaceae bacterium]